MTSCMYVCMYVYRRVGEDRDFLYVYVYVGIWDEVVFLYMYCECGYVGKDYKLCSCVYLSMYVCM